jgi:hypothetical protein
MYNFTPLNSSGNSAPHKPRNSHRNFIILSVIVIMVGVVGGYLAISRSTQLSSKATYSSGLSGGTSGGGGSTSGGSNSGGSNSGGSPSGPGYDECSLYPETCSNKKSCSEPCFADLECKSGLVCYRSSGVTGTCVLAQCASGANCTANKCALASPTPTKTKTPTPTKTNTPTPTPTPNPKCANTCTSDSQCPADHKCLNPDTLTSSGAKKCVLTKCTETGVVCTPDKCEVIVPSPTNKCPKPNPVKNLRINCPICNQN